MKPTFAELTEMVPEEKLPPLDRETLDPKAVWADPRIAEIQMKWRSDGVVILPEFMPDRLMNEYSALRERLKKPGGWKSPIPYMFYDEIKNLSLYHPLSQILEALIGEKMGLHLNLTGWISTEREWHQDDYLNPDFVMGHYLAVWIALEDVDPNSGPFEFVRGSHRWPLLRRKTVLEILGEDAIKDPNWPVRAEEFVTPACEAEILRRGAKVEQFVGKRGDVLIWHGRLLHQGSKPKIPGAVRKSLISHYSAISKRKDMPEAIFNLDSSRLVQGWYFNIDGKLDPSERV